VPQFVASLLDRLDDQGAPARGPDPSPSADALWSAEQFRQSVRRDLECLLNTRSPFPRLAEEFVEAKKSVLAYGLPDFSSYAALAGAHGEQSLMNDPLVLAEAIQEAIEFFEPRLTQVVVTPIGDTGRREPIVRLRVDARLRLDPADEPISFDIAMPLSTYAYEVKDAR